MEAQREPFLPVTVVVRLMRTVMWRVVVGVNLQHRPVSKGNGMGELVPAIASVGRGSVSTVSAALQRVTQGAFPATRDSPGKHLESVLRCLLG